MQGRLPTTAQWPKPGGSFGAAIRAARIDFWLPICALGLATLGVVAIYSATRADGTDFARKQVVWIVLGVGVGTAAACVDYRAITRASRFFYVLNLLLLLAVMVMGVHVKGAQRWIGLPGGFRLQPSEFAKLFMIITLSAYAGSRRAALKEFWGLCKAGLYVFLPMVLILKQPDLGTCLVLITIWFGIMWVAGARALHLAIIVVAGLLAFGGMWHTGLIKDYQKQRFASFWNPYADPKGTGWHTIQSTIAIGSGGLSGRGLLQGSQSQGGFIPEQHTDFVNTVVGEEMGFIGEAVLLLLFFGLVYRGIRTAANCDEWPGRLMAAGIVSMLTFHVFVNLGMTAHIMPVTGVPLPFLSYGGSSMFLNMAAVGLLVNIERHHEDLRF